MIHYLIISALKLVCDILLNMKIAILGGRFDPPHNGHFQIAQQVLELRPDMNRLLFVPAFQHAWKPIIASPKDRVAMLKTSLPPRSEVSDIEIKNKEISYAVDTLRTLKKETGADLYWIIGSDILSEFHRWKNSDELTKLATFLVFPRVGYPLSEELPKGFEKIDSPGLLISDLSSTSIRDLAKNKRSIKHLVPQGVERYIIENNLYE